jgi:beta-glucosidase-like glycosyl hydrolase
MEAIKRSAAMAAEEACVGLNWTLHMVDVARDARWGRVWKQVRMLRK